MVLMFLILGNLLTHSLIIHFLAIWFIVVGLQTESFRNISKFPNFHIKVQCVIFCWPQGRTLPPMTHNKSRVVSPIREISLKNKNSKKIKFIDKVKQGVYTEVFKGAEFKKGLYFMTRPILHCVLAWFLSEVCSIRQIVVGWIRGVLSTP